MMVGALPAVSLQEPIDDVLGMNNDFVPRFAKQYLNLEEMIGKVGANYAAEVRARRFPAAEHCFGTKPKTEKTNLKKSK